MTATRELQSGQGNKQGGRAGRHRIRVTGRTQVTDKGLAVTFFEMPLITKVQVPFTIIREDFLDSRQLGVAECESARHGA